jgi:hypothetical protein
MTNTTKLISHRGNLFGRDESIENNPNHIRSILNNFDCEIDVWLVDGNLFLGHDEPSFKIKKTFLKNRKLWCHAKNLFALEYMLENNIHCFYHDRDDFTLTSKGFIWTFPNKNVCGKSVIVDLNEDWSKNHYNSFAVCSDFILKNE